jgi:hypothetical protein
VNLDDDLAAWAATVRLPDAHADAIFRRIIAAPAGPAAAPAGPAVATAGAATGPVLTPRLAPSWWRGYNAGFAARMVASTAPVRLAA